MEDALVSDKGSSMTPRQRFWETAHFGSPDRVFFLRPWTWRKTLDRWHREGLPEDVELEDYFGTDPWGQTNVNSGHLGPVGGVLGLDPPFERIVLSEDDRHQLVRVEDGQVLKEDKLNPHDNMPSWIEYPLKTQDDWEREFVPRLDPHSPSRDWPNWDEHVATVRDRDYPMGMWSCSFWGRLQTWMGLERLSIAFFDEPSWVHEMLDYLCWYCKERIHQALHDIDFDWAFIWEDMGMKTGPMVSPRIFREFQLPRYKKMTEFLREHGIDVIIVDSDGQNAPIIPLWLEGGVNGLRPLEVAAGEDAVAYRRQYGERLILQGNIDKRVLSRTHEDIEAHVLSRVPWLLTQGGYFPQVDHLVPPDVSFDNYCFYWGLIQQVAEEPERYLEEARRRGLWSD